MAAMLYFVFFYVGGAAEADFSHTCHIVASSLEFPLRKEEMDFLKRKVSQANPVYASVAQVPSAMFRIAGETVYAALPATSRPPMVHLDRFKELAFASEMRFPPVSFNGHRELINVRVEVGGRTYELHAFLGGGVTSHVYLAVELGDATYKPYAIKVSKKQKETMPPDFVKHQILMEFNSMQLVRDFAHAPTAHAVGKIECATECGLVMVSEYIGPNLRHVRDRTPTQVLNLKDTLHYGIKLVRALQTLHSDFRLLHRDVKLDNILIKDAGTGFAEDNQLYLADFGTAMAYVTHDGLHIPEGQSYPFGGTFKYISQRALTRHAPTRADDMFSALLTLMELQGSYDSSQQKLRLRDMAMFDAQWLGTARARNVPAVFVKVWQATVNPGNRLTALHSQELPRYEMVINFFQNELYRLNTNPDNKNAKQYT